MTADGDGPETTEVPVLRVVAGHPTPAELAALVIALAALTPETTPPARTAPATGWADRARGLRRTLRPGPHTWTLSGRGGAE